MARYLITRLSALGDVAMLLQVLYAVARANEQHEFVLLTQPLMTELLIDAPDNVEAMAIDIRGEEGKLLGLLRYAGRLRREHFDAVLDLHDVLRTKLLRAYLWMTGVPFLHLKKPRRERKHLLQHGYRSEEDAVPAMWGLYLRVFQLAGLDVPEEVPPIPRHPLLEQAFARRYPELARLDHQRVRIGIAPFASTAAKTYDLERMRAVIEALAATERFDLFLFGGRGREQKLLEEWAGGRPHVRSIAGQLDLSDELLLISSLRAMVAMDSANMHLASLVGTRVLSVWCCTHPAAGFLGIGQRLEDCLQPEGLAHRPCSIFGDNKVCRSAPATTCSTSLPPEAITQAVLALLDTSSPA